MNYVIWFNPCFYVFIKKSSFLMLLLTYMHQHIYKYILYKIHSQNCSQHERFWNYHLLFLPLTSCFYSHFPLPIPLLCNLAPNKTCIPLLMQVWYMSNVFVNILSLFLSQWSSQWWGSREDTLYWTFTLSLH